MISSPPLLSCAAALHAARTDNACHFTECDSLTTGDSAAAMNFVAESGSRAAVRGVCAEILSAEGAGPGSDAQSPASGGSSVEVFGEDDLLHVDESRRHRREVLHVVEVAVVIVVSSGRIVDVAARHRCAVARSAGTAPLAGDVVGCAEADERAKILERIVTPVLVEAEVVFQAAVIVAGGGDIHAADERRIDGCYLARQAVIRRSTERGWSRAEGSNALAIIDTLSRGVAGSWLHQGGVGQDVDTISHDGGRFLDVTDR